MPGRAAARAAFALGVAYAVVSAYWGTGGTRLLGTVGGALEREARGAGAGLLAVVWLTVALKLAAAVLGLLAVRVPPPSRARGLAWTAGIVLVLYGGVLTTAGLLVESGAIHPAAAADRRALRWHAFLWDPWFLLWGVLLVAALVRSRRVRA